MTRFYTLTDDLVPVPCEGEHGGLHEYVQWAASLHHAGTYERFFQIGRTELMPDNVAVSTVFLGWDHSRSWKANAPPILWETMVFKAGEASECMRYASLEDAREGHNAVVRALASVPIVR